MIVWRSYSPLEEKVLMSDKSGSWKIDKYNQYISVPVTIPPSFWWKQVKSQLSHKQTVTEAIKPFTCSISDRRIGITLFILGLIKNIFHVPQNISTVVGITLRGQSYE